MISGSRGGLPLTASLLAFCVLGVSFGCGESSEGNQTSPALFTKLDLPYEQRQMVHFDILRGHPEPLDMASSGPLKTLGAKWGSAQRLPVAVRQVWVVPAAGRLCLVDASPEEAPSLVCNAVHRVVKAGLFLASVPAGRLNRTPTRTIVGLVPNAVKLVRVYTSAGRAKMSRVVNNVFAVRDAGRAFPESIELVRRGSSGA
jgi:hypothetical protein